MRKFTFDRYLQALLKFRKSEDMTLGYTGKDQYIAVVSSYDMFDINMQNNMRSASWSTTKNVNSLINT